VEQKRRENRPQPPPRHRGSGETRAAPKYDPIISAPPASNNSSSAKKSTNAKATV
jgi:hypothetical protein